VISRPAFTARPFVNSRSAAVSPVYRGYARTGGTAAFVRQPNAFAGRNRAAFNRGNNYGGRWFAGGAHPYWNRGGLHYWNGHYYRWWDNGWLICDNGFWPYSYPYYYPSDYSTDDSGYNPASISTATVTDVQSQLAQLGYYSGDIDGTAGPLTSQAIARYQSDRGLAVTGAINEQLLQSLGLE
jgi:hypothetical protein